MELTVEKAYEGILNGAKYEKGDPIFDWIHEFGTGNREKFIYYCKSKDFEQYIHDFKIWNKCKYVLKPMPLENDELEDESNLDENGEPINWTLFNFYDKLFKDYYLWKPTKSRLEIIIDQVQKNKKSIIKTNYEGEITSKIFWYESSLILLKEWIKHSGIITKQMLIENLPLDDDINQLILNLKIF